MEIKVFTVPVLGGEQENEEMNQFIRSHNVLETESQLVSQGGRSYWTFQPRLPPGPGPLV